MAVRKHRVKRPGHGSGTGRQPSVRFSLGRPDLAFPPLRLPPSCLDRRRLAWGFSHLFDDVKHSDYRPLRCEMEAYFGSRFVYYRYHRGFNKLYEEEQQWIDGLFRRYGYTAPRVYDNYRTSWKY